MRNATTLPSVISVAALNTLNSTSRIRSVTSVSCSATAQVRLVGAVSAHRVGIRHHRERLRQLDAQHLVEHGADHVFHHRADLGLVEERRLDVDLRELGLAVGAQVLVAEALDDLVVAVEARDHQQLLEELRRLRQREELARMHARRHQVVARAFRRALGQHRRLDVDEARCVEVACRTAIATL